MREFHFFSFVVPRSSKEEVFEWITALGLLDGDCKVTEIAGNYFVRMASNDPRSLKLARRLDALALDPPWGLRREIEYSQRDLDAAEYLLVWVTRAEKGHTGPLQDTQYDLSTGCPACGTGARQVSPLRINSSALPKSGEIAQTYSHEVLISDSTVRELLKELRSDRGLRQVEDRRSRERLGWWQLLSDVYMPPLDSVTGGLTQGCQCSVCNRDGFGQDLDSPLEPAYRMSQSERCGLPDVVFSYEHFGISRLTWEPGRSIGLAYPATLVSNRVMSIFVRRKVRGIRFIPVRFLD